MRYAWDLQHQYLRDAGLEHGLRGFITRLMLQALRNWDARSANGVDSFIANSDFVARRIHKCYRREAVVIHPPVDTDRFQAGSQRDDFYVTVSRLVPYKQVALIVQAFNRMPDRQLVVIGDGPELGRIRALAGPNIRIMGNQSAESTRDHLRRARAFIFAALEDFGIAPVEAQACGTPVIAYGRGGALETVQNGRTGVLFHEQSVEAIIAALGQFERSAGGFDPAVIRSNALRFREQRFRDELMRHVDALMHTAGPSLDAKVVQLRTAL
jgi:glycosyltransferase involved in cell wall biosynthesis